MTLKCYLSSPTIVTCYIQSVQSSVAHLLLLVISSTSLQRRWFNFLFLSVYRFQNKTVAHYIVIHWHHPSIVLRLRLFIRSSRSIALLFPYSSLHFSHFVYDRNGNTKTMRLITIHFISIFGALERYNKKEKLYAIF